VPTDYIRTLHITPLYDIGAVRVDVETTLGSPVYVEVLDGQTVVAKGAAIGSIVLDIPDFKPWSPDSPFLYHLQLSAEVDRVESYFGMRKSYVAKDNLGVPRLFLNDRPLFHNGLLDQGYWPDGLYTPPTEQAIVDELTAVKNLGFNMLRKHIKVEPLRWYYHCDRLGLMVWQDMPCGCTRPVDSVKYGLIPTLGLRRKKDNKYSFFGRTDAKGREFAEKEMLELVDLLYNSPSVVLWVPFNEGWGQFDASRICKSIRKADATRPLDHASH
jgi:beta-galactosidase/beta-glucuronidase